MAATVIRNFIAKALFKKQGAIANNRAVEFSANALENRLKNLGIDPNSIRSEQELNQILGLLKQAEDQAFQKRFGDMLGGSKFDRKGEVFDMQGKKMNPSKGIMGGKEINEQTLKEGLMKTDNPFSDLVNTPRPKTLAEREAEVLARLEKENKEAAQRIRDRKRLEDADNQESSYDDGPADFDPDADNETFATGGRAGFANGTGAPSIKYDFDKEQKPMGPSFETNDPEEALKEIVRRMINIEPAKVPLSEDMSLMFDLNRAQIGGSKDIGGGELNFGINKNFGRDDTGIGFNFIKKFAQGGRAGFFMGGPNPKGLGLLRQVLNYMSKKGIKENRFKGQDLSGLEMLKFSNPKRFNKLLEDVRGKVNIKEGIMGTDTVRAQQQALKKQRKGITAGSLEVAKDMKARDDALAKRIAEKAEKTIIPQTKKMMMEGMGMSEEAAERAARDLAKAGQNMRLIDDSPEITNEGILQLENVLKNMETGGKKARDLNAEGGRIGFKDGMTRRTFLKILGGAMSIPIVGKILKPLKLAKGVKKVPIIKTDNVPGKPEWFDQLVNKVIIEGDDVTKTFATGERQSIHQKRLDDGSVVRVTEDIDDGAVRVEYESETNVFGDTATMQYKKPLPDEGNPRPSAEFDVAESGPVGRAYGPDDYEIEIDEVGGSSIRDLDSDVSKLKEYATGEKPTMKELVQNIERKKKAKRITEDPEAQSDAVIARQGEALDYDDYASGGIARMLGE
jgi:hypothetical protein